MFADLSTRAFFRNIIIWTGVLLFVPFQTAQAGDRDALRPLENVQFCSSSRKAKILTTGIHGVFRGLKFESDTEIGPKGTSSNGFTSEWHTLKTRHTIIRYSSKDDLFKLNRKIQYYPGDTGIKSFLGLKDTKSLSEILKQKVDALYERAQEILDMRKQMEKVIINVYPNQKALDAAYYALFKEECLLRAWYLFEEKTVYINVEDVHEGMLAHEMGHHIIDHFLTVRPPAATAEILARYIDAHLYN